MSGHFFLLGEKITQERLTWIEETLKFYFLKLFPETLLHHSKTKDSVFTFLVTGDALYSLNEQETLPVWEIILSMPSVKIICNRQDLDLRGISIERLKMKNPDQVVDHNSMSLTGQTSFWKDVAKIARQMDEPLPSTIGYFQVESPYMHNSALDALMCLAAAVEVQASVELYCYLDGIHLGHINQDPVESLNIGNGLEQLSDRAGKRGLDCMMLACERSAAARGYRTWEDGKGVVISTCTIKPFRIRDLGSIINRFESNHVILGANAAFIRQKKDGSFSRSLSEKTSVPPITILLTRTPYGSEYTSAALSFAVGCAYRGIQTQVIFIEDGVYALTGKHSSREDSPSFSLQEIINSVGDSENLHLYAYQPSLSLRRIARNERISSVLEVGKTEMGQILFNPLGGSLASHQRVLFF